MAFLWARVQSLFLSLSQTLAKLEYLIFIDEPNSNTHYSTMLGSFTALLAPLIHDNECCHKSQDFGPWLKLIRLPHPIMENGGYFGADGHIKALCKYQSHTIPRYERKTLKRVIKLIFWVCQFWLKYQRNFSWHHINAIFIKCSLFYVLQSFQHSFWMSGLLRSYSSLICATFRNMSITIPLSLW